MVVVDERLIKSPETQKDPSQKGSEASENDQKNIPLFSPRFRSVAAMAGWDEEAILIASLVVEDTPERESKHKKRSELLHFKTPPTNSRRKRRVQRRSPVSIPVTVLDLDEDEPIKDESEKKKIESEVDAKEEKKTIEIESNDAKGSSDSSSSSAIPCIDRLREELSCAICLEICYEPSTTSCGHSFCKKCLRSAADKCGKKCPKCRQLISNGRSCTVNTVLWNTIQLLFPQEVEARKEAALASKIKQRSPPRVSHYNARSRTVLALNSPESENRNSGRRRRQSSSQNVGSRIVRTSGMNTRAAVSTSRRRDLPPNQDEDAALALRLQREEFMETFRGSDNQHRGSSSSFASARANLRAMASRAMDIRITGRESRG